MLTRRNLIFLIAIITFILSVIMAYQILVQGEFPWILAFTLLAVALIGLYIIGPSFLQSTTPGQPSFLQFQLQSLKATPVGILIVMLYDYWVRHTLRWEIYSALAIVQLVFLVVAILLSRRANVKL